jgi:hypothetical protein
MGSALAEAVVRTFVTQVQPERNEGRRPYDFQRATSVPRKPDRRPKH